VRLLLIALAAALLAPTAAALASPPAGDWTYIRKDHFKHYACKKKSKDGFTVKTATFLNGDAKAIEYGIGAYTALARSSNKRLIDERTSTAWRDDYVRTTLRCCRRLFWCFFLCEDWCERKSPSSRSAVLTSKPYC
jgi:hypothetical protein